MELSENLNIENNNNINNFFQSTFGQIIDKSLETGLRFLLPDFIENDVIEIKDTLVQQGFSEAVNTAIDKAIDLGKSAVGMITGNFENVTQAENVVEKGGLIQGISNAIDFVLDKVNGTGFITNDVVNIIKEGKNTILNTVSDDIKNEFNIQSEQIEKLDKYNKKWKEAFDSQDFQKMEKNIKKIEKIMSNIIPIENVIKEARTIENLHELIKNNGENFELTEDQMELAKALS
ncbi:MAG: hypothetical protein IKE01_00040 [Clostridia bacterium]|nr:hypothetical protein [Clostridia bacterium]